MPTSSCASKLEKKPNLHLKENLVYKANIDTKIKQKCDNFLTIEPALSLNDRRTLYKNSHSSLNDLTRPQHHQIIPQCDPFSLQTQPDGKIYITRTQKEKDTHPDRISLDRRGLTGVPVFQSETRLRLLSLQHNLINSLNGFINQTLEHLVFLDIYDNQVECISNHLETLENLRVLLMGKNRLKKIEGLHKLRKIEVLDLHGNRIVQINGGLKMLNELKVLNLAGNRLRCLGIDDLQGLKSLQELNLRRNQLKKLLGFTETSNLMKIFLSNNELQSVDDISSLAKATNLRDITIDNNPLCNGGEYVSFLVSYLPQLTKLNTLQITETVRKTAMAWRKNKEATNRSFMDLSSDVCLNIRREEIISNARTNWELLRTQTQKCLKSTTNTGTTLKNDFVLSNLMKPQNRPKTSNTRIPALNEKKLQRTSSQDTENSSSNTSSTEFFRLPPILVPILNKIEQQKTNNGLKLSPSLTSLGGNADSSISSLLSCEDEDSTSHSDHCSENELEQRGTNQKDEAENEKEIKIKTMEIQINASETSSNLSQPPSSSAENGTIKKTDRVLIKSAVNPKITTNLKTNQRATTGKLKKVVEKDREQGGDYLIEISGQFLNIYGQFALRFIERSWNPNKANDVTTVKFNYLNFNNIATIFSKLKLKFPNIEHLHFKETHLTFLGQLNALAEVQGFTSLFIESEGNPIMDKDWKNYAIYRLAHWGLKYINDIEITQEDIDKANKEYQSLSDLVLWSLPEILLQPLLSKLQLNLANHGINENNVKRWLLLADPALKNVVSKEALTWKKTNNNQDDVIARQKAKHHITILLDELHNTKNKLKLLEKEWPLILHEIVQNTLIDYMHLDMYMKQELEKLSKE